MTTQDIASLVLQSLIALAAFGTFCVYYRQMEIMRHQLATMRDAATAQNTIALINFLQTQDVRTARQRVRKELSTMPVEHWTESDKRDASAVVANYDVAAALIKEGLAPVELVTSNWGPSIRHCYHVLEPYMREVREREGGDPTYWTNFQWLHEQVQNPKITRPTPTGGTPSAGD